MGKIMTLMITEMNMWITTGVFRRLLSAQSSAEYAHGQLRYQLLESRSSSRAFPAPRRISGSHRGFPQRCPRMWYVTRDSNSYLLLLLILHDQSSLVVSVTASHQNGPGSNPAAINLINWIFLLFLCLLLLLLYLLILLLLYLLLLLLLLLLCLFFLLGFLIR